LPPKWKSASAISLDYLIVLKQEKRAEMRMVWWCRE